MTVVSSIAVGSHVWVEDPEVAWIDGEVLEVNGEEIKVICSSGDSIVTTAQNVYPKDPEAPPCGVDDMTKLAYLHEPGVLHNLRCRYDINEIYTYTGSILIAINPFQRLPHLYDNDIMEKYKGMALGELSPHPFAIADAAYRQMIKEDISQSILVSGESGAGKTESTKMLMRYLAYMGGSAKTEGQTVEQQVLESSPVLEAFGNAKTVRNNNSSRFGKFVELQFNSRCRISGAAIRTYLLERSRVCQVSDPERNYHCFYMLCAAPEEEIEKYKLGNPRMFHYLNQSNCYELEGVDDSKEYISTRRAMDVVGISSKDQEAIFRVVAAILHLGNIEFAKVSDGDASKPKDDQSRFHLRTAAELLMSDEKSLEDSLCKRVIITRDETITKSLGPDAAALSRDALAKIIYSRLFDWLVNKINSSIGQDPDSKFLIGVLDIYGFESFKTNSFEQFCINLTNEKLQQHFNQHIFKMEQEEYVKEEIDWSYIEFIDNQDILDLIEKKPGGIIALLDEACMFPRSTHHTFAEKLYQTFKDHKRLSKPKLSQTAFTISHYAGDVTYQTEQFLDKNKDYVVAEHQALLSASSCDFVAGLFPPLPEESSKSSKFSSIGSRFKQQLQALLETLSATEPHYVRCVKPNNLLKPAIFENSNVLQQLRCGGVMEAIRISCAGYPTRKDFDEFISRFKILEPDALAGSCDEITACRRLLEKTDIKGYQIGKTKVFLRAGQMAELDSYRSRILGLSASIIQRKYRTYLARKTFLSLRMSAVHIQAACRGQVARYFYMQKRRTAAASTIQKDARMFLTRNSYLLSRSCAILIQTGIRGLAARCELLFRKQTKAAMTIQRHSRGHLASSWYSRMKGAALAIQCSCRRTAACRELKKLKLAAKETGALQDAKTKLEKQVEELTLELQLEKRIRVELEEAKNLETEKLKSALEEMKLQFQEKEKLLLKDSEGAEKVADQDTPLENVQIINDELVNTLTAENEKLKILVSFLENKLDEREKKGNQEVPTVDGVPAAKDDEIVILTTENEKIKLLVSSLEKKINEMENNYAEVKKLSEDRLKQATEAESKIIQLKTEIQRLQEKIMDIEATEHVISHQPLMTCPSGRKPGRSVSSAQAAENGHFEPQSTKPAKRFTESDSMLRKSIIERQRENTDALIRCVTKDLGFSERKPVAAFTIYKCLIHWRSFEAEKTNVFDRLIQIIGSAMEEESNNDRMAYWLSNASTLLFFLQRTLKSTSSAPPQPTSFFGRMTQGFRSSPSFANLSIGGLEGVQQIEAKYPALLFKEQLSAYVETMYGILRDNSKKELSRVMSPCVQVPKVSQETFLTPDPNSSTREWQNVINCLDGLLCRLKDNCVPPVIVQKFFSQIFFYINVQLFNSLLLHKDCCTPSHGDYVKSGLVELELWCRNAEEFVGSCSDELKNVQQAVRFLVLPQKCEVTYDELTTELCPTLSNQQLYRICNFYTADNSSAEDSLSSEIISSIEILIKEDSNNADSSSYLLEDCTSIPFSVEDISRSLRDLDFRTIKPAAELLENPAFDFLR